jgi:hypothetical protein
MPVGYLVGVALVTLVTLVALVPLRAVGNLSFRLGLLLNEVPILGFYWLVADTSWRLPRGRSARPADGRRWGWPH